MEFGNLDRDVQKRIVRLLDIDSRRAINLFCKLAVPNEVKTLISNSMKQAEYEDYGRTEFYIMHVTPTYKIERWVAKESHQAGERYMQLAHTGYGDLYAWQYIAC